MRYMPLHTYLGMIDGPSPNTVLLLGSHASENWMPNR